MSEPLLTITVVEEGLTTSYRGDRVMLYRAEALVRGLGVVARGRGTTVQHALAHLDAKGDIVARALVAA